VTTTSGFQGDRESTFKPGGGMGIRSAASAAGTVTDQPFTQQIYFRDLVRFAMFGG